MEILMERNRARAANENEENESLQRDWTRLTDLVSRLVVVSSTEENISRNMVILHPALMCLCKLASESVVQHTISTELMSSSMLKDTIISKALVILPEKLFHWPGEPGGPISERVAHAMLDVFRRVPQELSDVPIELYELSRSVLQIIYRPFPGERENETERDRERERSISQCSRRKNSKNPVNELTLYETESFFERCAPKLRLLWLDVW
eukprot:CAMPEP_0182439636 /NCGR_PEP_ID=MMETSP1167-20130531/86555_1 /TAXON_ID=2988 /ORGANISM="Mallomonas Sp, Strain CCMP3275" /LENGTH=209 /DNA_ID=CAMNT_0024633379 /DNA_START=18 /DNA_END=644 /DNA_ORIENTATION=+